MLPTITQVPSPNFSSRGGAVPRFLIVHGTAGGTSAQNIANWFANPSSQVAAHYIIDRDATIIQCVDESMAAWANGPITGPPGTSGDGVHHDAWWDNAPQWGGLPNPNPITISIEHVKPSVDNSDTLTSAQQAASFALQLDICQRHGIPPRYATSSGGITGHYSMDPVNKSGCPGPYPWVSLWPYLSNGGTVIPTGWTDDGKTLLPPAAPDGKQYPITQGNRQFILDHVTAWDPTNVAIEAEHGLASGVTWQTFRRSALKWTAQTGVVFGDLGVQYLAAQAQVTTLQNQVAALESQATPQAQALSAIGTDLKSILAATGDALTKVTALG